MLQIVFPIPFFLFVPMIVMEIFICGIVRFLTSTGIMQLANNCYPSFSNNQWFAAC